MVTRNNRVMELNAVSNSGFEPEQMEVDSSQSNRNKVLSTSPEVAFKISDTANPEPRLNENQQMSCYSHYVKGLRFITVKIDNFYETLAKSLVKYPIIWCLVCSVAAALCTVGFLRLQVESRTEELYLPQNSIAQQHLETIRPYFGTLYDFRMENVIFYPKSGDNVMTPACIREAREIIQAIKSIPGFYELCQPKPTYLNSFEQYDRSHNCSLVNPIELISNDTESLANFNQALRQNKTMMSNGKLPVYNLKRMISHKDSLQTNVIKIKYLEFSAVLQGKSDDTKVLDWEKNFIDTMKKKVSALKCTNIAFLAQRSIDDSIGESTGGDITLASIAFTIMITFACVMLGSFSNPVRGHSTLAFFGVVLTAVGIAAGLGLSMAVGTPFVSLVGILPFLVLSIGIDDMFIIIHEFDKQDDEDRLQRVSKAMKRVGATITMTTLTDIAAFAVSITSKFPAIRYFCTFAALTFTVEFILQVTLFVVLVGFDARRINAKLRDFPPCCKGEDRSVCMSNVNGNLACLLMKKYAKLLMKWPTKVFVLIISFGLTAAGIYGCFHVSQEFSRTSLIKDGAYPLEYINIEENELAHSLPVMVAKIGIADYTDKDLQSQINQIPNAAFSTSYYLNSYDSWLSSYQKWISRNAHLNTSGRNFTKILVQNFLVDSKYSHYHQDINFDKNGDIVASRIHIFMKPTKKSGVQKSAMLSIRKELKERNIHLIPLSDRFMYFEIYAAVVDEVTRNICVAAGAVLLVTLPFCINPVVVLLLLFNFAVLITELIGLMYFWDVSINSISMINLVMSIGFAVDYSAHVAHAFVVSTEATVNKRVIAALESIGASVFMGGISTFLGMLATAFATSEIFRIFFRMLFGIVVFGLFNGLVLLPVLLSLFGFMIGSVGTFS